jgi:hypothetical protein
LRTNGQFIWWHVVDGVARARDAIDNGTLRDVYGSIEGAIIHVAVLATAFTRTTEVTHDAARWLKTGAHVRVDQKGRSNDASH